MNQMSSALAQAGVPLPSVQQRVWNYVKDHPSVTARRVYAELKLPEGSVSALLSQMTARGMMRVTNGRGGVTVRGVLHYTAVGERYDPDRFPCAAKKPAPVVVNLPKVPEPVIANPLELKPVPRSAQETINSLTVAEAREIWEILNRMFGSEK